MKLEDALRELADAHGHAALATAHARLRGVIRRKRQDSVGPLAETFRIAMQVWDEQKAAGLSQSERVAALEKSLRVAWPQTREWKYLCQKCLDYGLEMFDCPGDTTCGREQPHRPHDFGRPCWCAKGQRFKDPPKGDDDHTSAGKGTRKALRPMTRFGR